jgi:putative membrane protein
MSFILRTLVSALAIWLASLFLGDHLHFVPKDADGWDKVGIVIVVGLVFTLVTSIIRPIVKVLSLPLYILTLGLFSLVVNALMLMLTAWISEQLTWGVRVENFGWAVVAGLIIAILQALISIVIPAARD